MRYSGRIPLNARRWRAGKMFDNFTKRTHTHTPSPSVQIKAKRNPVAAAPQKQTEHQTSHTNANTHTHTHTHPHTQTHNHLFESSRRISATTRRMGVGGPAVGLFARTNSQKRQRFCLLVRLCAVGWCVCAGGGCSVVTHMCSHTKCAGTCFAQF